MKSFKRLSLRLRLGSGLAAMVAILAIVVFVTIDRVETNLAQTRSITGTQLPLLVAADRVVRGIEASTSALRGWVLLGEESYSVQRQAAFSHEIQPALEALAVMLKDEGPEAAGQLGEISGRVEALRRMQDEIEAAAHLPGNVPARQMFLDEAEPQAEIMADTLEKMVSLERYLPADEMRRQILLALAETQGAVVRAVSSIRAYLLTGDERFANALDRHWTRAVTRQQELFMADHALSEEQKAEWAAFSKAFRAFRPYPEKIVELRAQPDWNRAQHRMRQELAPLQAEVSAALDALHEDKLAAMVGEAESLLAGNERLLWISWLMLATGIALAVVVGSLVNRSVLSSVRSLADTIRTVQEEGALYRRADADTNDEIGLASKAFNSLMASWQQMVLSVNAFVDQLVSLGEETRLSNAATLENMHEQRGQARSISDALQNLQGVVERVADSARSNAETTARADLEAIESMRVVTETRQAVVALTREIGEVSQEVARLSADSQRIGDVLGVVQSIADQTNLLALNAAIEAARAGEVGRGFAVVADEVRTLARRTQESVNSVSQTVGNIQGRVSAVVDALDRGRARMAETDERSAHVEQALQRIVAGFSTANRSNDDILAAVLHKQQVAASISVSAGEITDFAERTVVQAQRSVDSAARLAELSASLRTLFAEFRIAERGDHDGGRGATAAEGSVSIF